MNIYGYYCDIYQIFVNRLGNLILFDRPIEILETLTTVKNTNK